MAARARQDLHGRMSTVGPARQHLHSRICPSASAGTAGSVQEDLYGRIGMVASAGQDLYGSMCTAGSARQHLQVR